MTQLSLLEFLRIITQLASAMEHLNHHHLNRKGWIPTTNSVYFEVDSKSIKIDPFGMIELSSSSSSSSTHDDNDDVALDNIVDQHQMWQACPCFTIDEKDDQLEHALWAPPQKQTQSSSEMSQSTPSSVWTFAMIVYCFLSLIEHPFGKDASVGSVKHFFLVEKKKLSRPSNCPSSLWKLLCWCWELDVNDRCVFEDVRSQLTLIHEVYASNDHSMELPVDFTPIPPSSSTSISSSSSSSSSSISDAAISTKPIHIIQDYHPTTQQQLNDIPSDPEQLILSSS